MSLMLLYFELGPRVQMTLPPPPIVALPTSVSLGKDKSTRQALAMTDGHSSERFLAYGKKVIAREGTRLRKSFAEYVSMRIGCGLDAYFVLVWVRGPLSTKALENFYKKIEVNISDLENIFVHLDPDQIVRVIGAREGNRQRYSFKKGKNRVTS